MGNDREDFELWLRSKWDGDAMKAARADFDKTKVKAKETDSALKDMGLTADALKGQLTGLLAAGAVWAQFKEGFEQVAALEQAMNQLERAAKRNGDNFDVVKGKIVGMAESLKKAAGVDDDAAIKKMSELYNATGDVANAMNLVALATDVAIGTGMDFERANDLVTKAAMGQTRGLKELNISIQEGGDKTENASRALEAIRKNFGGAANDAKGMKVEIDRLSESYEDMRNVTVEKLMPGISAAIKSVEAFFIILDGLWRVVSSTMVSATNAIVNAGSAVWKMLKGDFAGAKAAWAASKKDLSEWGDDIVESAQRTAAKVSEAWAGAKGGGVVAGKAKSIVGTGGGGGEETPEQKKAREKAAKDAEDLAERVFQFEQGLIKERAAAWQKFEASKLTLAKYSAKEISRIEKGIDAERERLMDAQTRRIVDMVRLQKAAEEANRQGALDTANAAIGLAGELFGDSKEIAIAQAIMNTYEGASKALAQGGIYGPVLAAIVIASGLAQVAKIQSAEPSDGGGFDNPANDAAARAGGRRWALDMVGEFTGGVSEGWSQGMRGFGRGGGGVSTDNSRTYNFNFHGAGFMDPSIMSDAKKLKRSMDVIDRTIDSQRTIARSRRS